MHIDFLRLLFLVGVICPLMQEHSLRLKKLISQALEDAKLKIRRPIYKRLFKSNRVLRADQKSVLNQTCSLHQDLMHRGCRGTTVPNVCLQALTLSLLSPRDFFTLSPNKEPVYRLKFILIWPHFLRLVKFVSLASSRFIHDRFHTYNG